ncbi:peptide/nickel transport system substrate-binding protein [Nocardia transvalensis]|uniref:Peptide/nickel transport system substrate-binding protein n=1 Tax=Nocardia transvalensis TaxID=37333 RepID=A0A7W9PIH1_9NOCA|nr:ABC transporter substrate-binding protein [Nocardia transvalensis]MBB5916103.1 peptide/nickel transport system substrate-binding protein [Nocardia transvalensis]
MTLLDRAVRTAAAALAVTAIAAGCAPADETGRPTTPGRGGHLTYLDAEAVASMQVQVSYWQNSLVKDQVLDRLVYQDPVTFRFVPWIAENWTVDGSGREYRFTIRDGVSYSDGQRLDAESVRRNLDWQFNGDKAKGIIRNPALPKAAGITADPGARTVTVVLEQPYAPLIPVLSMNTAGLVADRTIDADKETQSVPTNLIGSGPFAVESEVPDKKIVLAKRRGYAWPPATAPHQGEAYLDTVTVIPVTEDSIRVGALRAGQADAIRYTQPPDEQLLRGEGFDVRGLRTPGLANTLDVRQTAPYLRDITVRKAIGYGIDRQEILSTLYTDNWRAAQNIVTRGFPGYTDRSDAVRSDPREAERLLDASGWVSRDGDGFRTKDGQRLSVLIYVDVYDHTARPLYELIQRQLRRIGIDLVVRQTDFANYPSASVQDQVGLRRNGWPSPDPVRLWQNYDSKGGDLYALKGGDPTVDRLLRAQLVENDPRRRAELVREYTNYVIDNAYTIPLLEDTQIFAVAPRVRGFANAANSVPWFYNAWIDNGSGKRG